jgi:hypothetical protein
MEMEFQMEYNMGTWHDFDNREFFEFLWKYERLAKEKQKEHEAQQGNKSLNLQDGLGGAFGNRQ